MSEIIVTAQRRAERLEDVAASVTAVSSSIIERAGISRIEDLGRVVPGLVVSRTGNVQQPAIRGISSLITGLGQEANVAIYLDGYYQDRGQNADALGAISDIQVLKGPQGSLYGRNATGGAILITTPDPKDHLSGDVTGSYSSYNDVRLKANVSLPLTDSLALGLTGVYRSTHGYLKQIGGYGGASINVFPNPQSAIDTTQRPAPYKQKAFRAKLKYSPTDSFTSTLGVNYLHFEDPIQITYIQWQRISLLPAARALGLPVSTDRDQTSLNARAQYPLTSWQYTLTNNLETGDYGELSSHTLYSESTYRSIADFDGTPLNGNFFDSRAFSRTYNQAVDYQYKGIDKLDLIVGGMYYAANYRSRTFSTANASTPPFARTLNSAQTVLMRSKAWAAYFDATYEAAPSLFLTVGARYSWDHKFVRIQSPIGSTVVAAWFPPSKSWDAVTLRGVVRYEFAPDANVYASFNQGFKSGTINTGGSPNIVRPEKINAYEIGVKASRWGLNGSLSAYHYDYKDLQVQSLITPVLVSLTNAATAKVDGVEAQLQGNVTRALSVRAGVNYMHARYDKYPTAQAVGVNPVTGFNTTALSQDWSGVQIPRAPMWSGNIGADYTIDDGIPGKVVATVDVTLSGSYFPFNPSYYTTAPFSYRYRQSKYALANATLTWTDDSDRLSIGVFGENITNTRYKVTNTGSSFGDYRLYNWPRVVGVRVGMKMD